MEDGQVLHMSPYAAQIEKFADSLKRLSQVAVQIEEKKKSFTEEEIYEIFYKIQNTVCLRCEKRGLCWEDNLDQTYQIGYEILSAVDNYGDEMTTEAKRKLQQCCEDAPRFLRGLLEAFHEARKNLIWNNRIIRSRENNAVQMDIFSEILRVTSKEMEDSMVSDERLEKKIISALKKKGARVLSIYMMLSQEGKMEVHLTMRAMPEACLTLKMIGKEVSAAMGRAMTAVGTSAQVLGKDYENIICMEKTKFHSLYGVARLGKSASNISGDNFMAAELPGAKQCFALSDGMGSGEEACRESTLVIELLEELLEAGFPEKLAVQMINATLIMGREEICYSTIDMTVLDFYTGKCQFIKAGASSTFIKRKETVEHLVSTSLPVGVVSKLEIDCEERMLESGDFVVMMTDGIMDALPVKEQEILLETIIGGTKMNNPKEMAAHILQQILNFTGEEPQDDMTVLVVGIWEK
ncbi:MAG: SpoIIE family protein phosphatase [Ruminococcus sp.]|nr:SpoIIE family protein phosphatase [Ruminococcus sp.]